MANKNDKLTFKMNRPKDAEQFIPPGSEKQGRTNWDNFDKPSHLYSSGRWQKLRAQVLTENPLCFFDEKIATQVHHIHRGDENFFRIDNLVSICDECHDKVNSAYRRKIDKTILFGDRGKPLIKEGE